MTTAPVPISHLVPSASLTATQFEPLAGIAPKFESFPNLTKANPRQAYRQDIQDFKASACLDRPEQFPDVTSARVIAWRQPLTRQGLANDAIRRILAPLPSLYTYLHKRQAGSHNLVLGAKRLRSMSRAGLTPALVDHQARMLLEAPSADTLKGKPDRSILKAAGFPPPFMGLVLS